MNNYLKLCNIYQKIDCLNSINETLGWDQAVVMPPKGGELRGLQLESLGEIVYQKFTDGKLKKLIDSIEERELSKTDLRNFSLIKKAYQHINALDQELYISFIIASSKTELVWREAKKAKDFNIVKSELENLVNIVREIASRKADLFRCTLYEALADEFDPDSKETYLDNLFSNLKIELKGLLPSIIDRNSDHKKITEINVEVNKQTNFFKDLMKILGFDFEGGRLDESEHPFCSGRRGDIRITTKYKMDNFIDSMLAVIHETGHALYEQNLPVEFSNLPIGKTLSMSLHESQSLFYENHIGMSEEFLSYLHPIILKNFNLSESILSKEALINNSRVVTPSLIRIEADEATYPMHIIIRYEIEKALLHGKIEVKDLPEFWNYKVEELLGIKVPDDSVGCMQDIHWYSGGFGYFPCYLLGSLIASQLREKMSEKIDFSYNALKGNIAPITNWLKNNIHNKGFRESSLDLVKSVTGKELTSSAFIRHIKSRYMA